MTTPFDGVVGQARAVAHLEAASRSPVHAYLFVGPPGSGKRAAALAFAAALLCPDAGCGECRTCRLVASGRHPDLRIVEPEGAFLMVKQADAIITQASLAPAEGRYNVLVLDSFQDVHPQAAPKLLKIIEEPPPRTVFVILTEDVPTELVTIASRCVRIDFSPLAPEVIADVLVEDGVERERAVDVAALAGGRLDRARLLASDANFAARRELWRSLPDRLDGTGAAVAAAVDDIGKALDQAGEVLAVRHAAERAALDAEAEATGARGADRKDLADRHKRELRRLRTDEVRFGLATLAGVYRDAVLSGDASAAAAIDVVQRAAESLIRNPNETLLLQATLLRLSDLA